MTNDTQHGLDLTGEVAIVTGAASGIGAATAELLWQLGARVMATDVTVDGFGERAAGERWRTGALDVTSAEQWDTAVARCVSTWGAPTVLVNNAGVVSRATLAEITLEEFHRVTSVNQLGCLLGMQAVGERMRANGRGSIVNVASVGGITGMAGNGAYVASKWAVRGLTRVAALELAPEVRVNAVLPGRVLTGMTAGGDDRAAVSGIPAERAADPKEIASAIAFLASSAASYVTGTDLLVDGGRLAGYRPIR